MSNSFRTQREDRVAIRAQARHPRLRITVTPPYPGDIHPLSKAAVRRFLQSVPAEFLYGLRTVELRARNHSVGRPYAQYRPAGRSIVLYSIPPTWTCSARARRLIAEVEEYGAVVIRRTNIATITWPRRRDLERWFEFDVLGHELAHHFREHFQHKNGRLGRYWEEERMADQTAERLWSYVREQKRRSNTGASASPAPPIAANASDDGTR